MPGRRLVLVVEDHADTRHMVEEYLAFSGIPTIGAENGERALEALSQHRPSLILLDLTMPIMDGWQFRSAQLGHAERDLAAVPVIVLSALPDADVHAQRLGAVDVVRKPVDLDGLAVLVERHLEDV